MGITLQFKEFLNVASEEHYQHIVIEMKSATPWMLPLVIMTQILTIIIGSRGGKFTIGQHMDSAQNIPTSWLGLRALLDNMLSA